MNQAQFWFLKKKVLKGGFLDGSSNLPLTPVPIPNRFHI
jgi:hypothetical protein